MKLPKITTIVRKLFKAKNLTKNPIFPPITVKNLRKRLLTILKRKPKTPAKKSKFSLKELKKEFPGLFESETTPAGATKAAIQASFLSQFFISFIETIPPSEREQLIREYEQYGSDYISDKLLNQYGMRDDYIEFLKGRNITDTDSLLVDFDLYMRGNLAELMELMS